MRNWCGPRRQPVKLLVRARDNLSSRVAVGLPGQGGSYIEAQRDQVAVGARHGIRPAPPCATVRDDRRAGNPALIILKKWAVPMMRLREIRACQAHYFIVDVRRPALNELGALFANGALQANIGEILPLAEAPLAHEMIAGRPHRRGKIVLDIDSRL